MEKLSVCLPPGFGFHPTDVELISHYLKLKILGNKFDDLIPEVDIYKHEPWDLPGNCTCNFVIHHILMFFAMDLIMI